MIHRRRRRINQKKRNKLYQVCCYKSCYNFTQSLGYKRILILTEWHERSPEYGNCIVEINQCIFIYLVSKIIQIIISQALTVAARQDRSFRRVCNGFTYLTCLTNHSKLQALVMSTKHFLLCRSTEISAEIMFDVGAAWYGNRSRRERPAGP